MGDGLLVIIRGAAVERVDGENDGDMGIGNACRQRGDFLGRALRGRRAISGRQNVLKHECFLPSNRFG